MNVRKMRLSKDELYRILFLKKELKQIILKSIKKNQQLKNNIRLRAAYLYQKNTSFITKQKNYCLLTSKSGGVYKITNTSRHCINKLAQEGFLINVKSNNTK